MQQRTGKQQSCSNLSDVITINNDDEYLERAMLPCKRHRVLVEPLIKEPTTCVGKSKKRKVVN